MYWGAIQILDETENSERLAMAAHTLRELQNRLPVVLDVPEATERMLLEEEFPSLADGWERTLKRTRCRSAAGDWTGELDPPLVRFLRKFDDMVRRFRDRNPRMERVSNAALRRLDPALDAVPADYASEAASAWLRVRKTFVDFAHYKLDDEATFTATLTEFEALLNNRLFPRTFETQAELSELVREAEGNAADS